MGINRNFKIDREKPDYIVLIGPRATSTVEREKYVFAKNEKKGAKLLRLKPGVAMPDELKSNDDFVSLGAVKRKREGEDSSDDSEAEHTHYRSIEGKAKPRTLPEDEKFEYLSASESDSEARRTVEIDEDARKEYVILSRAVNANKEDIEAWMALIHHQENMLGLNGRRKRTDAERRSTAEIKLDMYKKALKSCGTTLQNRERIILGIIEEGAKIWSPGEQAKRWEKVMKAEPQSDLLWRRYQESRIQ